MAKYAIEVLLRWFVMDLSWPQSGLNLAQVASKVGSRSFHRGRIFTYGAHCRSMTSSGSSKMFFRGFKFAYGGRKWFKLNARRTHDALGKSQDGIL